MQEPATDPNAAAKTAALSIKQLIGDTNDTFEQTDLVALSDKYIARLKEMGIPMGINGTIFNWEPYYRALVDIAAKPWVGKKYGDFVATDFDALAGDRWLRTIGLGWGVIPGSVGGDPFAQEKGLQTALDAAGMMGKIFGFLLDPANWIRIFALVIGIVLIGKSLQGIQ